MGTITSFSADQVAIDSTTCQYYFRTSEYASSFRVVVGGSTKASGSNPSNPKSGTFTLALGRTYTVELYVTFSDQSTDYDSVTVYMEESPAATSTMQVVRYFDGVSEGTVYATYTVTQGDTLSLASYRPSTTDKGNYNFDYAQVNGVGAHLTTTFTVPSSSWFTLDYHFVSPAGPYIWNGSEWKPATPYIWDGSEWKPATAYVWDGSAWQS